MSELINPVNAQVVSVFPDKIKIIVDDLEDFKIAEESLKVGSYLKIEDNENATLIAVIENFQITVTDQGERTHLIEAFPLGILRGDTFERGGDSLAIPPKEVKPATIEEIKKIYETSIKKEDAFCFSTLSTNPSVKVPVNGNKFFNKHIAVVGSTGSGKSHTLSTLIQKAISEKSGDFTLNNSHIIIFDIHSEYATAFPDANYIDTSNLVLPYWLLNSEELEEFFLDTEANDHNQRYIFKESIVNNRKSNSIGSEQERAKIHFDSPLFFDIHKVLEYAIEKNTELIDTGETYQTGAKKGESKTTQGSLYGKLTNFINRLENKVNDTRLEFLLGEKAKKQSFEETIENLLSYSEKKKSNVTIIDLSGVPFEVCQLPFH